MKAHAGALHTATNLLGLSYVDATAAHKRTSTGYECIWEVSIREGLQDVLANLHIIKERERERGGCALQVPFLLNFEIENSIAGCFGNSSTENKFFRVCD